MVVDFTHVSQHYFLRVMDLVQFVSFSFQFYLIPDTCGGHQHWTEWRGAGPTVPRRSGHLQPLPHHHLHPRDLIHFHHRQASLSLPAGGLQPGLPRAEEQHERARAGDRHVETPPSRDQPGQLAEAFLLPARRLPGAQLAAGLCLPRGPGPRPASRHQALRRGGELGLPGPRAEHEHLLALRQPPPLQQRSDLVLGKLRLRPSPSACCLPSLS